MPAVDMRTTVLTYILVNYLYTFVLAFTWYQSKNHRWGTGYILADFLFKGIGMTLATFRGSISPFISIVVANLFMFAGTISMLFGMAQFLKQSLQKWPYFLYTFVFTLLYSWYALVEVNVRMRIILFSGMLAPIFIYITWMIFFRAEHSLRKHATHAGVTFALFALAFLGRVLCAMAGGPVSHYFNQPISDSLLVLTCQVLSIYLAYAILLMINSKLFELTDLHLDTHKKRP
ncbi:MAG: hypothetical protein MI742_13005 [Desulfobacterales bacterium]|nr:hypothetical protein [Desulfobacterales bacterium]